MSVTVYICYKIHIYPCLSVFICVIYLPKIEPGPFPIRLELEQKFKFSNTLSGSIPVNERLSAGFLPVEQASLPV